MERIQDIANFSCDQAKQFINSFDYVFSDLDGTLLMSGTPIPGSVICIDKLKKLGKQVAFVTNNTISSFNTIKEELGHFNVSDHEIVTPTLCITAYLEKINCPKEIYCVGGHTVKDALRKAGYHVVNENIETIVESMPHLKEVCLEYKEKFKNVGAVVMDYDINFKLIDAQIAIILLTHNKNIIFVCAATDESGPLTEDIELIGNKFYVNAIEQIAKKECTILAKPSIKLKEFLEERYQVDNPKRVLFIGDSLTSDIVFANKAGFQSLLVLSGQTKLENLEHWTREEELRPSYYVESLGIFGELLSQWSFI